MTVLRALLFNLGYVGLTVVLGLLFLPLLARRRWARYAVTVWSRAVLAWLALTVGLRYEVRGLEHLPDRPAILAAKHQSAFETIALNAVFPQSCFILKQELFLVPFAGMYIWRSGHIGIDRKGGAAALKAMTRHARTALARGQPIVIFPEGTRMAPGERGRYHPGVAMLVQAAEAPVVPVALNSGLFWKRKAFMKRPGTITIEILPPLPAGLDRKAMMTQLQDRIETATDGLSVSAGATPRAVPS